MKTTIILCGGLLLALGCGTTDTSQTHQPIRNGRVDRQWAREAGMHQQEWFVMHQPALPVAEPAAPATEPAQGGAATIGQAVTVTTGSGLEILDQAEIDLRKEELVVGKREVSNGGVLIRTVVQTEPVSETVDLRREEYVIERIPAGSRDQQTSSGTAFLGREIYIPLMREEAISGKKTVLTEVIKLGKKIETDRQTVSAPVRTEDVEIIKNPALSDPKFSAVPRRAPGGLTTYTETGTSSQAATDGALRLAREQFVVGKQEVDAGGVYLQKVIRTETASQPVELQREEYVVERTPASGEAPGADFSQRQIIMLGLKREEAVAGTRNYIAETIRVKKQLQTDQQLVSGTVRKEAVEIVKLAEPTAGMGGTTISGQSGVTLISESSCEKTRDELLSEHVEECLAKPSRSEPPYANIDAIAADGVVTLKGTVASEKEKTAIGKRVRKMSGVRSVNNQLAIEKP